MASVSWECKFGTSGWRGILADEFTLPRVRAVVAAIAEVLAEERPGGEVIVACDARFLGGLLVQEAASILAAAGFAPRLADRPTPTPVVAHAIRDRSARGGINFTASHNPPEYQGLKFSPANGGPAPKELTAEIERRATKIFADRRNVPRGKIPPDAYFDPREAYFRAIEKRVDLEAIGKADLSILTSPLGGAGSGYLDELLERAGARFTARRTDFDPTFGGHPPEPAPEYIRGLLDELRDGPYDLGLFLDGDADRFGVADADGTLLEAGEVIAILLDDLAGREGADGAFAVRSVATTHLIDRVAKARGASVREVPVGFKWIAKEMEAEPNAFLIGGEESGGLTIRGHVPEKDGILACLLVAELVARSGRSPKDLLADLHGRVGTLRFRRVNLRFEASARADVLGRLAGVEEIAGRTVASRNEIDGVKFLLEGGAWTLVRFSGTEPVIRLYIEAESDGALDEIETAMRNRLGL